MANNNDVAIAFEGSSEIIKELIAATDQLEIDRTDPIQKSSLAEPLDAPLGAEEMQAIVEIVILVLKFGTALLSFYKVAMPIFKSNPDEKIAIKNPETGEKIGELNSNTSEEDIKKIVQKLQKAKNDSSS